MAANYLEKSEDDLILDYLTNKLLDDLRRGLPLSNELYLAVDRRPYVDHLRQSMQPQDADIIERLCTSDAMEQKALGISLMQPLVSMENVRVLLFKMWKEAKDEDYEIKRRLVWKLLDIPDLPKESHEEIYRFIASDTKRFVDASKHWIEGDILDYCKERLADLSFPESKVWIYLIFASTSTRTKEVEAIISRYRSSNASIVADIAEKLLPAQS